MFNIKASLGKTQLGDHTTEKAFSSIAGSQAEYDNKF